MADATIRACVTDLLDGDLSAAMPLIDRMKEHGDDRLNGFVFNLGQLVDSAGDIERGQPGRRSRDETAEHRAYRRDEDSYRAWRTFANSLRANFWEELLDTSLGEAMKATVSHLSATKQAERERRAQGRDAQDEDGGEDGPGGMPYPGEMMGGMTQSNAYRTRSEHG